MATLLSTLSFISCNIEYVTRYLALIDVLYDILNLESQDYNRTLSSTTRTACLEPFDIVREMASYHDNTHPSNLVESTLSDFSISSASKSVLSTIFQHESIHSLTCL